ncbi:MAG: hypothetical protein WAM21_06155 [Steroidobacteraceae bacterium]
MTDEVIRWHLSGTDAEGKPFVAGIYPLLTDDTCWSVGDHAEPSPQGRGGRSHR